MKIQAVILAPNSEDLVVPAVSVNDVIFPLHDRPLIVTEALAEAQAFVNDLETRVISLVRRKQK